MVSPLQVPAEQVSPVVHTLPSSQLLALFAWEHVPSPSHESSVQTLPSSQE